MAKVENKRLYLSEKERPEWWKQDEYVQIIVNNEDMFFVWHRQAAKDGYIQIDEYFSIEVELITRKWTVKHHSPECICLIGEAIEMIREKIEKSKEKIIEEDFMLSRDLRDVDNIRKEDYIYSYKELLGKLLSGDIGVGRYKAAEEALQVLIREYELFEPESKPQVTSIEQLKQMLLDKAQQPNANIIDLIRSIKSLDEDGNMKTRERQLDDIIIETDEVKDESEEIEIEIG